MSPKDSQITKIQVWHYNDDHIRGFKLFNNDVVVLEAGEFSNKMIEVPLEAGERLVAIKSKLYCKCPCDNTAVHCNLVLVLGKLA
jgi:hypothetical protein